MCVVQARSQGGGGGWGVNPQKSLHKKLWVYIWLFCRLQSLIALKIRPLNMAMELKQLSIVMTAITLLYLLSGNCWIIK